LAHNSFSQPLPTYVKIDLPSLSRSKFADFNSITHATIGGTPDIADAVILTAIGLDIKSVNANGLVRSFDFRIANQQDGDKYGAFDNGYVTWVDTYSQVNTYFKKPFYDIPTTDFAEAAKQPFGVAEFLTFLNGNNGKFEAEGFEGPVLVSGLHLLPHK
jgi:hypothetical protein